MSHAELPPPAQLMNLIAGKTITQAIGAAASLGVADRLAGGPRTAGELASELGVHAPSLYRLMRALTVPGVLEEAMDGRFSLTPMGALLRSDVPGSLAAFARFFGEGWHSQLWADLAACVKTGEGAPRRVLGKPGFEWLMEHPREYQIFNDAMTCFTGMEVAAVVEGYDFSGLEKIADVGGGHGALLAGILQATPGGRGVLFDLPQVVAGAREILGRSGTLERCELVGGDFFKTVPAGCDAYVMKHIIHDWDDDRCVAILGLCREAMAPGGRVLVIEQILPPPGVPAFAKLLDLEMLVVTEGGRERTEKEYAALFERAGLRLSRSVPLPPSPIAIVEAHRA